MTARLKEIRKTLETSNMMSGSRYIVAWFSLIFILNMHVMMAKNIDRFKRFTKKDVCNGTVFSFVEMCPESEKDYQERSEKISCESYPPCLGEPLVYHCVRLEVELVEVCAPRNQIIGRCCPVYDRRLGRVREDYNSPGSECPFKYQSDDTVKYVSCVKKAQTVNAIPKLNKLTNVTANSNISGSTSSPCCKGARCKRNVDGCTEQTPTNKNNKPKRNGRNITLEDLTTKLILAIMITCSVIIISYSCYRIYRNITDKLESPLHPGLIKIMESEA